MYVVPRPSDAGTDDKSAPIIYPCASEIFLPDDANAGGPSFGEFAAGYDGTALATAIGAAATVELDVSSARRPPVKATAKAATSRV
jgi:hypothetical protein